MTQPGDQPNMSQLLAQAQQMQQQLAQAQEELAQMRVQGSAGGGLVIATVNGGGELQALTISPDAADPEDVESLQDLVVAAVRDAGRAAQERTEEKMGPLTSALGGAGGLGGPSGGLGLPGAG